MRTLTDEAMQQMFDLVLQEHGVDKDQDAVLSFERMKELFVSMKSKLTAARADEDDMKVFVDTVDRAITQPPMPAVRSFEPPEHAQEVRDVLRSVFDGVPEHIPTGFAHGSFLHWVSLADPESEGAGPLQIK